MSVDSKDMSLEGSNKDLLAGDSNEMLSTETNDMSPKECTEIPESGELSNAEEYTGFSSADIKDEPSALPEGGSAEPKHIFPDMEISSGNSDTMLSADSTQTLFAYSKETPLADSTGQQLLAHTSKTLLTDTSETLLAHSSGKLLADSSETPLAYSKETLLMDSSETLLTHSSETLSTDSSETPLAYSEETLLTDSSETLLAFSKETLLTDSSETLLTDSSEMLLPHSKETLLTDSSETPLDDTSETLLAYSKETLSAISIQTLSVESTETQMAYSEDMSILKQKDISDTDSEAATESKQMLSAESQDISSGECKEMSSTEELQPVSAMTSKELSMKEQDSKIESNETSSTNVNELTTGEGRGHKILGVELAPVNVPYHRRAETFAVIQWLALFLYFGFGAIIVSVILLFTDYYWLTLILYSIMIYDRHTPHTGGRSWAWFRKLRLWKHLANYYPAHLYKTADLDPNYNYLFGYHPHGIIVAGGFVNFCTEATGFSQLFPGITPHLLSLAGFFQYPFAREYLLATGLCAASSESFDALLGKSVSGTAAIIVVGGAVEVLEAYPNHYSVYLSRRKGFVRKAIQHGAHLVPVYSFGETDVYDQYTMAKDSWKRNIQVKFNKIVGFPPILFHGRGIFNYSLGPLPYRRPINTVVGRPIRITMNPHPTKQEIDEIHREYMESLTALFDEYKERFGLAKDEQLEII